MWVIWIIKISHTFWAGMFIMSSQTTTFVNFKYSVILLPLPRLTLQPKQAYWMLFVPSISIIICHNICHLSKILLDMVTDVTVNTITCIVVVKIKKWSAINCKSFWDVIYNWNGQIASHTNRRRSLSFINQYA